MTGIIYDNQFDKYALIKGVESDTYPLDNLGLGDTSKVTVITSNTAGEVILDLACVKKCDALVLGAGRHNAASRRFSTGNVKVECKTAANTLTTVLDTPIVGGDSKSQIDWFSAHTPYTVSIPGDLASTINNTDLSFTTTKLFINHLGYFIPSKDGVIKSTDGGATWTQQNIFVGENCINVIGDASGNVVAAFSTRIYESTDGVTWTLRHTTTSLKGVVYNNGKYFSLRLGGTSSTSIVSSSDDLITWTQIYTNADAQATTITAVNNIVVFYYHRVSVSGAHVDFSVDNGSTWSSSNQIVAGNVFPDDLVFHIDRWIISSNPATSGSVRLRYSFDLTTWFDVVFDHIQTALLIPVNHFTTLTSLGNELYVTAEELNGSVTSFFIYKTTDFLNFTQVATSANRFYAISDGVKLFTLYQTTATQVDISQSSEDPLYRITFYNQPVSTDIQLPEIFIGPYIKMKGLSYPFDPYPEVDGISALTTNSGRLYESINYTRVEPKPRWDRINELTILELEVFREWLEQRKTFWWAWDLTKKNEVYLVKNKATSRPLPKVNAVHRTFGLDLVEYL